MWGINFFTATKNDILNSKMNIDEGDKMENTTTSHNAKYPVQTLEKALDIIELLFKENSNKGFGISELSRKLGIGKSTVHRFLDTLVAYGYIEKSIENNRYCLGWKLFEIGNTIPIQRNLYNFDTNLLNDLCNEYQETVNLGVKVDSDVVTIFKVEPSTTLKANLEVGRREALHATGMGKVLISECSKTELVKLLGDKELKSYTPKTITSLDNLVAELEKVREQGYSIDDEEFCLGLSCIAMPIRNYKNEIIAAVSVSGPSFRLSFNKILDIKNSLEKVTKKLSNYLGYAQLFKSS